MHVAVADELVVLADRSQHNRLVVAGEDSNVIDLNGYYWHETHVAMCGNVNLRFPERLRNSQMPRCRSDGDLSRGPQAMLATPCAVDGTPVWPSHRRE